jgi:hypothetical protein
MASSSLRSSPRKGKGTMGLSAVPEIWKEEILDAASDRFEQQLAVEMTELRMTLCTTIHKDLTDVRQELATTRVEMLKWSFVFWAGQLVAMAGLLAFMFPKH